MGSRRSLPWAAIGSAGVATGLGLGYMQAAEAPPSYLGINAVALVIGIGVVGLIKRARSPETGQNGLGTLLLGLSLVAGSQFGVTVNGATRWVSLGGFALQPSLLLVPVMVVQFGRSRDALSTCGIALASVALALQPDRGMAGALLLGLVGGAVIRPDRKALIALFFASAGFVATLAQSDEQPAMPFVDQIFFTSFDVHPLAGLAVFAGATLLLLPAFVRREGDVHDDGARAAFGAIWFGVSFAAALGNYPTPVVGYGGSAIIGYVLSALPLSTATAIEQGRSSGGVTEHPDPS